MLPVQVHVPVGNLNLSIFYSMLKLLYGHNVDGSYISHSLSTTKECLAKWYEEGNYTPLMH